AAVGLVDGDREGDAGRRHLLPACRQLELESSGDGRSRVRERADSVRRLPASGEYVDASRRDLRRRGAAALRQRRAGREPQPVGTDRGLERRGADRRKRGLGRVLPGAHRRGSDLQPRADRRGDPAGYGDGGGTVTFEAARLAALVPVLALVMAAPTSVLGQEDLPLSV